MPLLAVMQNIDVAPVTGAMTKETSTLSLFTRGQEIGTVGLIHCTAFLL